MHRRLFRHLRSFCDRRGLLCLLTLVSFAGTSVGIPLEPLGQPRAGCRCGEDVRANGTCCCQRAGKSVCASEAPASGASCCRTDAAKSDGCQSAASTRSACCATVDAHSCCDGTPSDSERSETCGEPYITACSCGGPTDAGIALNAEPRTLPRAILLSGPAAEARWRPASEPRRPHRTLSPETPPPEVHGV